jgi:hypothetical protein
MKKLLQRVKKWPDQIKQWPQQFKEWRTSRERLELLLEEVKILERDRKERAHIAHVFNYRYATGTVYDKTRKGEKMPGDKGDWDRELPMGFKWMCPDCNQLHDPLRFSHFTGIIYPACCETREGSRNDDLGDGANLKRPIGWCGPDGLFRKMLSAGMKPQSRAE